MLKQVLSSLKPSTHPLGWEKCCQQLTVRILRAEPAAHLSYIFFADMCECSNVLD